MSTKKLSDFDRDVLTHRLTAEWEEPPQVDETQPTTRAAPDEVAEGRAKIDNYIGKHGSLIEEAKKIRQRILDKCGNTSATFDPKKNPELADSMGRLFGDASGGINADMYAAVLKARGEEREKDRLDSLDYMPVKSLDMEGVQKELLKKLLLKLVKTIVEESKDPNMQLLAILLDSIGADEDELVEEIEKGLGSGIGVRAADIGAAGNPFSSKDNLFLQNDLNSVVSGFEDSMSNTMTECAANLIFLRDLQELEDLNRAAIRSLEGYKITDTGGGDVVEKIRDWIAKCIPCDARILTEGNFIPSLFKRTKEGAIDKFTEAGLKVKETVTNPWASIVGFGDKVLDGVEGQLDSVDVFSDVCSVVGSLGGMCIPDLEKILILLDLLMEKQGGMFSMDLDIVAALLAPIFSPIFIELTGFLDRFEQLLVKPIECVITELGRQIVSLQGKAATTTEKAIDVWERGQKVVDPEASKDISVLATATRNETRGKFEELRKGTSKGLSSALSANPLSTGLEELRRVLRAGVDYQKKWFRDIVEQLESLLGTSVDNLDSKLGLAGNKTRLTRYAGIAKFLIEAHKKGDIMCGSGGLEEEQVREVVKQYIESNTLGLTAEDTAEGLVLSRTEDGAPTRSEARDVPEGRKIVVRNCLSMPTEADMNRISQWISDIEGAE